MVQPEFRNQPEAPPRDESNGLRSASNFTASMVTLLAAKSLALSFETVVATAEVLAAT